jgi:hypothetical protein
MCASLLMSNSTISLRINRWLWYRLIVELRKRGDNQRESGAFLLGESKSNRISKLVYYDDLESAALSTGFISLPGNAFAELWQFCQEHGMEPLADIHTHGGKCTSQSTTDKTNPFVSFPGHLSIILPYYAQKNSFGLNGVGIYEYLGDHKWKTYSSYDQRVKLVML